MRYVGIKSAVLRLLSQYPDGLPQSFIHRALGVSKSRVSEVLKDLELAGIVTRVRLGNQYIVRVRGGVKVSKVGNVFRLGLVWSSEYPFITPFAKLLRDELNYGLEVTVYPNALSATWALIEGEVDLALSPLITQLYAYSLTKALRVIGGGAYGGSLVMCNQRALGDDIASSELSTMDVCRAVAVREGISPASGTHYFTKPTDEVVRLASGGRVRYIVIWHPLIEELLRLGLKPIAECRDLDISYCCTLAASSRIDDGLRERVSRIYVRALEEFMKSPMRWVEWYSAKVGIEADVIRRGLNYYEFRPYLDRSLINKMIRRVGIEVPNLESLTNAIEIY